MVKTPLNHFEEFNAATNGEPAKMLELLISECTQLKALAARPASAMRPFEVLALTRASRHLYVTLSDVRERLSKIETGPSKKALKKEYHQRAGIVG